MAILHESAQHFSQAPDSILPSVNIASPSEEAEMVDSAPRLDASIPTSTDRPQSPTQLARMLEARLTPIFPSVATPTNTPRHDHSSSAISRRTAFRYGLGALAALLAVPAIPATLNAMGHRPDTRVEHPDEKYYGIFKQVVEDAFGDKFGPVSPEDRETFTYPDLPTFLQTKRLNTNNPPQPQLTLLFGVPGAEANTPLVPLTVTTYFKADTHSAYHSRDSLQRVVIEGDVSPLFGTPDTIDDMEAIIRALIKDSGQLTITTGSTGSTGGPSGAGGRESYQAAIATKQTNDGGVTTKISVNQAAKLRYDHSYNIV